MQPRLKEETVRRKGAKAVLYIPVDEVHGTGGKSQLGEASEAERRFSYIHTPSTIASAKGNIEPRRNYT